MLSDIEAYLVRRQNLFPAPQLVFESDIDSLGVYLYRAQIFDRFSGEWKTTIQDAFDSLEAYLRSVGEIV
tara:strand:+ start:972 stop:1181 length:210 start_codon:yes stop_codon:yes gene_type:complete